MRYQLFVRFVTSIAMAGSLTLICAQEPDNTKANKGDQPTADQAKNTTSDREIMQNIRKALTSDSSLSSYAHNVKVISKNGKVTLKGVVHSDAEKQAIESKAVEVAGTGNVTNELTVKPEKNNPDNTGK